MRADIEHLHRLTRRHFLQQSQLGLGAIALSSLLARDGGAAPVIDAINPLATRAPHFPAKAKQVIYLHMTGSPPNLDLWDYKPELVKRDGEDCPDSFLAGRTFAFTTGVPKLLGTPRKFERYVKVASGCRTRAALHEVAEAVHCIRCTPSGSTMRRPNCSSTPARPALAGRRWARG
jgi:hypothetical protein